MIVIRGSSSQNPFSGNGFPFSLFNNNDDDGSDFPLLSPLFPNFRNNEDDESDIDNIEATPTQCGLICQIFSQFDEQIRQLEDEIKQVRDKVQDNENETEVNDDDDDENTKTTYEEKVKITYL